MPCRTLMWRVSSVTTMSRDGLSCHGKNANALILSALVELMSSWMSKIAGYLAKDFYHCCLLQVSANIEAYFGGRRGGEGFDRLSLVFPRVEL